MKGAFVITFLPIFAIFLFLQFKSQNAEFRALNFKMKHLR